MHSTTILLFFKLSGLQRNARKLELLRSGQNNVVYLKTIIIDLHQPPSFISLGANGAILHERGFHKTQNSGVNGSRLDRVVFSVDSYSSSLLDRITWLSHVDVKNSAD